MIKVGISGANGTMGRLTIGAIDAVDDLTIGGLYAPGRGDQHIQGNSASGDPASLSECDVVIELTKPIGLRRERPPVARQRHGCVDRHVRLYRGPRRCFA